MLLDIAFLDDSTRPTVPPLTGLTPAQKRSGAHLKEIHDHLRGDMRAIRDLIERAGAGKVSPADAASEAADLTLVSNFRRFGNLCGHYCAIVETHHSIEDYHLFPAIARISEGYRKVAERLKAEHAVVHELLERQMAALEDLAREPTAGKFDAARTVFEALERVLLSHLGYEEDQIGDALGYYNVL